MLNNKKRSGLVAAIVVVALLALSGGNLQAIGFEDDGYFCGLSGEPEVSGADMFCKYASGERFLAYSCSAGSIAVLTGDGLHADCLGQAEGSNAAADTGPICGDGFVTQPGEDCDGDAGVIDGYICMSCKLQPGPKKALASIVQDFTGVLPEDLTLFVLAGGFAFTVVGGFLVFKKRK